MGDKVAEKGTWPNRSLPQGWEWREFERVFKNVTDSSRKLQQTEYQTDGEYPVIDQGAGFIGGYTSDRSLVLPEKPPYIVFGDHTRCVKFVDFPFVQGADGVKVLAPNDVDPKYAYYAMKTIKLPDKGYSRHYRFLRASVFPIAPAKLQSRIVERIEELFSSLDAGVAALERSRANLKRYRASVLKAAVEGRLTAEWRKVHPDVEPASELLKRILAERRQKWNGRGKYKEPTAPDTTFLPHLPEGWTWTTADQICSQITDGEHIQPRYQPTGQPMLSAKNVRNGYIDFGDVDYISDTDFKVCLNRCAPTEGDILIVSVGATTGRTAIVGSCEPFVVVRSVLLLRALINKGYLLRWFQSPWCQTYIQRASGSSAQAHLYIRDTKVVPIPLPPDNEQTQIVAEVERLLSVVDEQDATVTANLQRAARLRQAILQKTFHGTLEGSIK